MTSKPWWLTDTYTGEHAVPDVFEEASGPQGLGLVKAWPSGLTDPGWGLIGSNGRDGFIPRYYRGEFNARRVVHGYNRDKWAFAFIMRSLRMVCIDIDGKNGGFDGARHLGMLPPTLSETSKSGNGYHLFYLYEENWVTDRGYGELGDRIGIEQGVDVRATGCVYHHKQQRWNDREPVALPVHLKELLLHREQQIHAQTARIISVLASNDPMEVLMMQDTMLDDLAKPIPAGKRNQTLFAIGSQMEAAQVPDWEDKIRERADQIGLPADEGDKIVANIKRYATATP